MIEKEISPSPTLLVIDDDADYAELVANIAKEAGYEVEVTTSSKVFMDKIKLSHPDVAVIDIVIPETDGIELVNFLVDINYKGALFLISGYDPLYMKIAERIASAKGANIVTTLNKPIDNETLYQKLLALKR